MATQATITPLHQPISLKNSRLKSFSKYFKRNGFLFLLMLPGLVHLLMIQYMPMFGVVLAFKDYKVKDGIFGSQWIGFENFRFLFGSDIAWTITFNTVFMNLLFIITGTSVALLFALLLNEIYTSRLAQVYQFTLFIPFFIGAVIVGYIAYAILSNNGFINTTLRDFGLEGIQFYLEPSYWRGILTSANLWMGVGFGTIIYLSGIIGINPEYFEAAELDGAGKIQQIWNITIPLIRYLIVIQLLLAVGKIFFANFGLFYFVPQIYKNGALLPVADVIDTFVFRALYGGAGSTGIVKIGMAAAAGFYQSMVGFILVLLANLFVRKVSSEQALF
jgi:putative aldouronate transport system permease protein